MMAKKPPKIRLDERTRKEYNRLRNNARSKIRRTQKNYGVNLEDEVKLPSLESFNTRKEFNEWKQSVSSFTNRSNLHYQFVKNDWNVVTTKAEIEEIKRDYKKALQTAKKFNKAIDKLPVYDDDGNIIRTVKQERQMMARPTQGMSLPPEFDFSKVRSPQRLKSIKKNLKNKADPGRIDRRLQVMKENYMEALSKAFNSDADKALYMLDKISPLDFYNLYLMKPGSMHFNLFYPVSEVVGQADDGVIQEIEAIFEEYHNGNIDIPLRDF